MPALVPTTRNGGLRSPRIAVATLMQDCRNGRAVTTNSRNAFDRGLTAPGAAARYSWAAPKLAYVG